MIFKKNLFLMLFYFIVFTGFIFRLTAQNDAKNGFSVGMKSHYGFIIPHSEAIASQAFSNPFMLSLEAVWHLNKEKIWQNFGTYPRVGASIFLIDFDNPEVLGQGYGLVPFFSPYFSLNKRLNMSFRMGIGGVYLTQVYDVEKNPQNLFYSASLSFLLHLNLAVHYKISDRFHLQLAGYYNHISNGGVKLPNKGINFPTLSLGLEYVIRPAIFRVQQKKDWQEIHTKRNFWQITVLGTGKTVQEGDNQRYPIVGVYTGYQKIISRLSGLNAGVEWIYDEASAEKSRRENQNIHAQKASILAGHTLLLGKFRFSQQLGVYVFNQRAVDPPFYQRYGLDFYFTENKFIGLNLKSHGDVADFMDFRLGFSF